VSSYTLAGSHGVSVEAFGPVVALELVVQPCETFPGLVLVHVEWRTPDGTRGYGTPLGPGHTCLVGALGEGVSLVIRRTLAP